MAAVVARCRGRPPPHTSCWAPVVFRVAPRAGLRLTYHRPPPRQRVGGERALGGRRWASLGRPLEARGAVAMGVRRSDRCLEWIGEGERLCQNGLSTGVRIFSAITSITVGDVNSIFSPKMGMLET
jgi:hypothetical protein